MIDSSLSEFWWNHITGAHMLVSQVAQSLFDNKIVVLKVPDDLPWRHQMRATIELLVRNKAESENTLVQMIDVADDCAGQDPGRFLLQQYGRSQEITRGYRSASSKTIQQYLLSNKVLHNSVIWVKGVSEEEGEKWLNFCKHYKTKDFTDGTFILELKDCPKLNATLPFAVVSYDECISVYDVQVFNSFLLNRSHKYSNAWKKYISVLAASLCERDAEISSVFLDSIDFTKKDPLVALKIIDDSGEYSSRGQNNSSKHVLSLYRNSKTDELMQRIWNAQVQTLFSILEIERRKLVDFYYDQIQEELNNQAEGSYGDVNDPYDVEVGPLWHMVREGAFRTCENNYQKIRKLRDYRNELAHLHCLAPQDICDLLAGIK